MGTNGDETNAAVAATSDWMARVRATEHARPDRLLADPYAELLACAEDDAVYTALLALGPPTEIVPLRARFGDVVLSQAIAAGVTQVVNLGAGSDTRPYRLDLPERVTVFEVDQPGRLAAKHRTLAASGAKPTGQLVTVDADLRDDWPSELTRAGFAPGVPALWIMEGLSYYLAASVADALLDRIGLLSAPGSWIELDIAHARYYDEPENAPFLAGMAERGIPFAGATDDAAAWLARHGWTAEAFLAADLAVGRGPITEPVPARLNVPSRPIWLAYGQR